MGCKAFMLLLLHYLPVILNDANPKAYFKLIAHRIPSLQVLPEYYCHQDHRMEQTIPHR